MLRRNKRIILALLIIFSIANLGYLFVNFNPQLTVTHIQLTKSRQKDLTTIPGGIVSIYVYDSVVYGVYNSVNNSRILFGYSDHFVFQTPIENATYSSFRNIRLITDAGIFVDNSKILVYNFKGQLMGILDNPVRTRTTTASGEKLLNYYGVRMVSTNDAIYKITTINQHSLSKPTDPPVIYLHIEGWKKPVSNFLEATPDLKQQIYLNDSNYDNIWYPIFQKKSNTNLMELLLVKNGGVNRTNVYYRQFQMNLDQFKLVKSKEFVDTESLNSNSVAYFILSETPIKIYYPTRAPTQPLYDNKLLVTNLATREVVNLTSSLYYEVFWMTDFSSSMVFFGGGKQDNTVRSSFITLSIRNGKFVSDQALGEPLNSAIQPIYTMTEASNNVYLATASLGYTDFQIIEFSGAIRQTLFLSTINPGLQLNTLGLTVAVMYLVVEYYTYRRAKSVPKQINLSYPENSQ